MGVAADFSAATLEQQWVQQRQPALLWLDASNKLIAATESARTLLRNPLPAGLAIAVLAQKKDARRLARILSQAWISVSGGPVAASSYTATIRLRTHTPGVARTILRLEFSAASHTAGRLLCCELTDISASQGQARLLRWLTWYFAGPTVLMRETSEPIAPPESSQNDGHIGGQAVARHANFLRVMAMNSGNLFMVFDIAGICQYATPSIERLLGYQAKQMLGRTGHWMTLNADWAVMEAAFMDALAQETGAVRRVECTVRHADGHPVVLAAELMHFGLSGQMRGIMGTFRDITGQRRVSDALVQSERRFSALMEYAQDVVSVVDINGAITYVSPSVQRYLGYTAPELQGRRFLDLVPSAERPEVAAALEALRSSNTSSSSDSQTASPFRHRALSKNGSERVFASIGSNQLDDLAIAGIIIHSSDVTRESLDSARR